MRSELLFSFILFLISTCFPCNAAAFSPMNEGENHHNSIEWKDKIRPDHPRLFFDEPSLPIIKKRAFNDERETLEKIKHRIDSLIQEKIEFNNVSAPDGGATSNHMWGFRASEAAMLYHLYEDKRYLHYTKNILIELTNYYHLRNNSKLNIHWYAYSQISALCAFDWIYSSLSREEQLSIGSSLLTAINGMIYDGKREKFFRENTSGYKTGFYGPTVLPWYAGLVFYKTGIDDVLAEKLLLKGYDDHMDLLKYRESICGTVGGAATACMEYAFRFYPWAEFNFFHTFNSATGLDITQSWDYPMGYLNYMDWNWLPKNREFGYGDVRHFSNKLPTEDINMHLSQLMHFYGENRPAFTSLAKRLQARTRRRDIETFPFIRFFISEPREEAGNHITANREQSALFFENMGQIFMRSGSGDNDTYALFTSGGILSEHKHFDNNNFVIYKQGYRTLDSGTRPQPGLHLSHYYCRTVAHNCITIKMPGEEMPEYWHGDVLPALSEKIEPIPNDGGQCRVLGSKVLSFLQNQDYVYIASDATASYHEDKTSFVLRQFVYLLPDVFIVFDKVIATNPEYKKRWLLHTVAEPQMRGTNEFLEESEEGRLICRTLFPEQALVTKIGGPGKQFWSGGKNWALPVLTPDDWNYNIRHWTPEDTHPLVGQWRIEVSPSTEKKKDCFLHVMQVGDLSLQSLPNTEIINKKNEIGVSFDYNSKKYTIVFNTESAKSGGKISIKEDGKVIRNDHFNEGVIQ